ncbi:MAG: energy-coupling factor ABC transporter substrate-binding protein [Bacillota bacterium]|nr:energy-coupling factor ABC transporter substrate-binding protein [Bacillota bacterium]
MTAVKKNKVKKSIIKTLALVAIVIALAALPLLLVKDGKFGGSDDKAQKAINEINADYKPWFSPLFKPKSGEVESLLFALQAAIGSGIVFFGLGYMMGRKKGKEAANNDIH